MLAAARDALPELPGQRRDRYRDELGLPEELATQLAFEAELGAYFERVLAEATDGAEARAVANWVTGELAAELREAGEEDPGRVEPGALAALVGMVQAKRVTHGAAKQVLAELVAGGGDPAQIVETRGLAQISDSGELEAAVKRAIEANPEAAERVRGGNAKAIGPIVGAVMKETKGRADGGEVTRLIREKLGA
jgi:aspartyl-tRNA(Asn)/glutamyl-tRNA(Gln) amidotransferase subunit B